MKQRIHLQSLKPQCDNNISFCVHILMFLHVPVTCDLRRSTFEGLCYIHLVQVSQNDPSKHLPLFSMDFWHLKTSCQVSELCKGDTPGDASTYANMDRKCGLCNAIWLTVSVNLASIGTTPWSVITARFSSSLAMLAMAAQTAASTSLSSDLRSDTINSKPPTKDRTISPASWKNKMTKSLGMMFK